MDAKLPVALTLALSLAAACGGDKPRGKLQQPAPPGATAPVGAPGVATPTAAIPTTGAPTVAPPATGPAPPATGPAPVAVAAAGEAPGKKTIRPPVAAAPAPAASPRIGEAPKAKELVDKAKTHFEGPGASRRLYIQVDKPLYKPGETIWIKTWDLKLATLDGGAGQPGVNYQLVSPKGAVVLRKKVKADEGVATNDFVIPEGVQGGEYKVKAVAFDGVTSERPIIVSTYEPPRVKKKLEFVRKAYGAGDAVSATITVKRPTGEPLKAHPLKAMITLDGQALPAVQLTTNEHGGGLVKFALPAKIERGDGLLTVLVEDGGVTESVSKRIPIILKKVQLAFFPEGGDLVTGLPTRVYFEAKNTIGKPADVKGRVIDDHGNTAATFESYKNGLGRFAFTPATGRTYRAEITQPVGVVEKVALPIAKEAGCVLTSYDDLDGQAAELRVAVHCTDAREVIVVGAQRDAIIDAAKVAVAPGKASVVYLKAEDAALQARIGIARVTVFDAEQQPLVERIVFRNRRARLGVKVEPHKASYAPRDQVTLKVTTTDASGKPIPAELALSVVDDTVISFADDKKGHLLSQLLMEHEIPGKVEEPKFYFDLKEEKSAVAMDLLMGTRGYRRFDWKPVMNPPSPDPLDGLAMDGAIGIGGAGGVGLRGLGKGGGGRGRVAGLGAGRKGAAMKDARMRQPRKAMRARKARKVPMALAGAGRPAKKGAPMRGPVGNKPAAGPAPAAAAVVVAPTPAKRAEAPRQPAAAARAAAGDQLFKARLQDQPAEAVVAADKDWDDAKAGQAEEADEAEIMAEARPRRIEQAWAPVRVFPAPKYDADYAGPRNDFRETVHWEPVVKTGKDGQATVSFHLSDAVTSLRVFAEGVGRGLPGRAEKTFKSSLPFSMNVKLPLEVSSGDALKLPLTLTNDQDKALTVKITASLGDQVKLTDPGAGLREVALGPGERKSLLYDATVTGKRGKSEVRFTAEAKGLKDDFTRELNVVPIGFPIELSRSGELSATAPLTFALGEAEKGTITASVKLYPSPVATMVSGLEGMLREPSGCFEQASSTNYPNVMVMNYLKSHDKVDVALLERSQRLLDKGYRKLTGYESKEKGYEWFGGNPGHEALTAYGLVQFVDMQGVYDVDPAMVRRTSSWLRARRDGNGGYKRNARALDSFGRAKPVTTDAYITWSLTEAGETGLDKEIAVSKKLAAETADAYLLALATNTLLNTAATKAEGLTAAKKLAGLQDASGAWTGAAESITRSSGSNLTIETTALSVLALLKASGQDGAVRKAVSWLNQNRSGFGRWGATQATVLSLRAMKAYAESSRKTRSAGDVEVKVGETVVGRFSYQAGHQGTIEFSALGAHFGPGDNTLHLTHTGKDALPYSVALGFRSATPASSPDTVVALTTTLARPQLKMGENVRLTATVTNKTAAGQPMTLARVGLPGGLTFQTWQLKELKDKGLIAFYETRAREVILYFRDMKPSEVKTIPLDLVATVPGTYTAPASSAYLYYTDDQKAWVPGLKAEVTL